MTREKQIEIAKLLNDDLNNELNAYSDEIKEHKQKIRKNLNKIKEDGNDTKRITYLLSKIKHSVNLIEFWNDSINNKTKNLLIGVNTQ